MSKKTIFVMLFLFALPVAFGVAGSPTTGAQWCETFTSCTDYGSCSSASGNFYAPGGFVQEDYILDGYLNTAFVDDGNGGQSYGNTDGASAFIFNPGHPAVKDTRTLAWRMRIDDTKPPGMCGQGIRAFNLEMHRLGFESEFNVSNALQVLITPTYTIEVKLIDRHVEQWMAISHPLNAGWHTFVLRMGATGAQLYIDGIKDGTANGINNTAVPLQLDYDEETGYDTIGAGDIVDFTSGGIQFQSSACTYDIDNFVFDTQQWDAQRISEYREGNAFTCTPSALTGDVTNPSAVVQNYTQPVGVSNFTFAVIDNAELGNATINCNEHSETFQLIGFNKTLGANFDATITQTCSVQVFDSSGNTASDSFIITIESEATSPPTLVGEPFDFVSAIANFTAEVLIALIVFAILVYPFWKMAKNK